MVASITADKLTKYYGRSKVAALDSLSLDIKSGEVYGFLGANGAGKSTTIRLLMNFLQPSTGRATINGLDVVKDAVQIKRQVGYLSGDVALYQKTTGQELLDYLARLQTGVDPAYRRALEQRFEADLHKPIGSLSKGNRQKLGILQAFMHQPDVLILDEPTSGLDPLMQEAFYDSLAEVRARGAAVLMSSHNLAEAQRVCDRIGIIKHGKLIREQAVGQDKQVGSQLFHIVLAHQDDISRLQHHQQGTIVSSKGSAVVLKPSGSLAAFLKLLSTVDIVDLRTQEPDLEDEFIGYYGDNDV